MTEAQWGSCQSPRKMIRNLGKRFAGRKQRLFLCGIGRLLGRDLPPPYEELLLAQEALAEGDVDIESYREREGRLLEAASRSQKADASALFDADAVWNVMGAVVSYDARNAVRAALEWGEVAVTRIVPQRSRPQVRVRFLADVCGLLRELFPLPSRTYSLQPDFVGGGILLPDGATFHVPETARAIADGIQHDQAFDRLPILADALEDAHCPDRPLLDHLRHGTNHRRGCWALDVVIGRS